MRTTDEQAALVTAALNGADLAVEALAGTGKTTTLTFRRTLWAIVLGGLTACASDGAAVQGQLAFDDAFRARASCAELFDIRNEMDPNSLGVIRANEKLRSVGCYFNGSIRAD